MSNVMDVTGKSLSQDPHYHLTINLADDENEVRGYGQPITACFAKKLIKNYVDNYWSAKRYIDGIKSDPTNRHLVALKELLDMDHHIVSGVFGKELILQILAQKDCEGIRYVFGQYTPPSTTNDPSPKPQTTLILMGVKETYSDGNIKSEPLPYAEFFRKIDTTNETYAASNPIFGEVHGSSQTVQQVIDDNNISTEDPTEKALDDFTNAVLGLY